MFYHKKKQGRKVFRLRKEVIFHMKGTMLEYLKEFGNVPFAQKPVSEVDFMIICQLAYLKFAGMVPDAREDSASVGLLDIARTGDEKVLFADERFEKQNRVLWSAVLQSKRFNTMKLNSYIDIVEKEWEAQFSAFTCSLEDGTVMVIFRGTDENIVGWKEDFNMVYQSPIPSQAYAVKYLNMIGDRVRCPLYLAGHSKGGNLAVYGAMNCRADIQDRIIKIYNLDGPGFKKEVLEKCGYERIVDRVVKILPHSSVVGMIFEWDARYKVVESNNFGILQHDLFSWQVVDGALVPVPQVYDSLQQMEHTLADWMMSLEEDRAKRFVDTLFDIISASETDDFVEFAANGMGTVKKVFEAYKDMDEDTKKMLKETIQSFTKLAGDRWMEGAKVSLNNLLGIK